MSYFIQLEFVVCVKHAHFYIGKYWATKNPSLCPCKIAINIKIGVCVYKINILQPK